MSRHAFVLFSVLLISVVFGCGGRHDGLMRARMAVIDSLNRHYQPFAIDSVEEIARYFDTHGTSHDRAMAYYLLGSAYRDAGEAPAALNAFQHAIEQADTTGSTCDYRLLAKIHYQMGMLFLSQYLPMSAKKEIQKATHDALQAGDTLMSLDYQRFVVSVYYQLQMQDSVIAYTELIASQLLARGDTVNAARTLFIAISQHIANQEYDKAKRLLQVYEHDGSIYDGQGQVRQELLLYLYYDGLCLLHQGYNKEAGQYFRQLLRRANDMEQVKGGYDGLRRLYLSENVKDSAMKYTMLYANANDTCYARQSRNEMTSMQGMYNYERYERLAVKQSEKLAITRMYAILVVSLLIIAALIGSWAFSVHNRNKQRELMKKQIELHRTQNEINRLEHELSDLNAQGKDAQMLIQSKEKEIARLKHRLLAYRPQEDILPDVKRMARTGLSLSFQEWSEIENYMHEEDPHFIPELQRLCNRLTPQEYRICLLTRLKFDVAAIAVLLDTSSAVVSKSRSHLMVKIFNDHSGAKRFNYRILSI